LLVFFFIWLALGFEANVYLFVVLTFSPFWGGELPEAATIIFWQIAKS
jgi:hypothetical protein